MSDTIAQLLYWLKFWEWPGRIMKLIDQWHAMRESAHRARIAKVELDVAEAGKTNALREIQIADMMQKIRDLTNRSARQNPGHQVFLNLQPEPDDNPEIFEEAVRRIKQELRQR